MKKVKGDVAAFGLVPEEWGGDTPYIAISAKNKENIDKLLDTILIHAEITELKGQTNCSAEAVVIESHLDQKLGVVTVALVTKDTIKLGDIIQAGAVLGKIKKLSTTDNLYLKEATIAIPVIILGLNNVVNSGQIINVHPDQKSANQAISQETSKITNRKNFTSNDNVEEDTINIILKADVLGSLEALKESILKIPQEQIKVSIKSESVGVVSQNDLNYAKTTNSTILAFHTDLEKNVVDQVRNGDVNIVQSDIIYEILQWVEEEILKNIKHETTIQVLGFAEVLATFTSEKPNIQVFGGEVKNGKILDNKMLRLIRNGEDIGQFEILELQRNKAKTSEVNISQQFGMSVKGKTKIQKGDTIECIDEIIIS